MFHVDLPQVSQPHAVSEFEDIDLAIRLLGAHEASAVLPGLYHISGQHDGCPVYQRWHPAAVQKVFVYYWRAEKRWYVGPEIGGDSVWCCKDSASGLPPRREWQWSGHVLKTMRVFTLQVSYMQRASKSFLRPVARSRKFRWSLRKSRNSLKLESSRRSAS